MNFFVKHENFKELIWALAKTDFKLRYNNSVLGYLWAILKPLMMFAVLNFVFSFVFKQQNNPYYSLQLLVSLVVFNFFSEGTVAGMSSLLSKSQLVTKIYVPRWTIILASTLNSAMIFLVNLVIIVFFFVMKGFLPSLTSIFFFLIFSIMTYIIIVSFSFLTAPLYVKFRDLSMIWEVLINILFYATPIFYPIEMLPSHIQRIILINPMAFIVQFNKAALINNYFPSVWQFGVFFLTIIIGFMLSIFMYKKFIPRVAEEM